MKLVALCSELLRTKKGRPVCSKASPTVDGKLFYYCYYYCFWLLLWPIHVELGWPEFPRNQQKEAAQTSETKIEADKIERFEIGEVNSLHCSLS